MEAKHYIHYPRLTPSLTLTQVTLIQSHSVAHTQSHSHSVIVTLTHSHTQLQSHSVTITLSQSHCHTQSFPLTHTLTHTFSHSVIPTHTYSHPLTLNHSHSHSHTHTLPPTHLTHSVTVTHTHSPACLTPGSRTSLSSNASSACPESRPRPADCMHSAWRSQCPLSVLERGRSLTGTDLVTLVEQRPNQQREMT